jgi:pilin isopeptide linkage protein
MPGTTTNAADGTVTFDQLPFDAAGTYEYTLVQVAGVTYDSTEYAATITVTATADNTLTAAVSYAKDGETVDAATFANVYKAPTKPSEPTQPAEPVS